MDIVDELQHFINFFSRDYNPLIIFFIIGFVLGGC